MSHLYCLQLQQLLYFSSRFVLDTPQSLFGFHCARSSVVMLVMVDKWDNLSGYTVHIGNQHYIQLTCQSKDIDIFNDYTHASWTGMEEKIVLKKLLIFVTTKIYGRQKF